MSRRRSEAAFAEAIAGVVGLVFLLCMLDPKFKEGVIGLLYLIISVVVLGVIAVAAFVIIRSRLRRKASATTPARVIDIHSLNVSAAEPAQPLPPEEAAATPEPSLPIARRRVTEDDLRRMDWCQFEKVIGLLYEGRGWRVEQRGGANPDGGIDLAIWREGEGVAIQCKHWQNWKVRERDIRDFFGGMKIAGFERGIFATLSGCTSYAQKLANKTGISIFDIRHLQTLLGQATPDTLERIQAILQDPTKHCPKCGAEMVIRTARRGPEPGSQFWACTRFPQCNGKMRLSD